MVKCGVLFEVRTEFLNIIYTSFGFTGLICSVCARLVVHISLHDSSYFRNFERFHITHSFVCVCTCQDLYIVEFPNTFFVDHCNKQVQETCFENLQFSVTAELYCTQQRGLSYYLARQTL
jgi:hypothetical protein